jgi:bile acid:Na+ symporter, BASS family
MAFIFELVLILFKFSIMVTVFSYGLYARSEHFLHPFRLPRIYILSLLAMFFVTPMIALMIALTFDALAFDIPMIAEIAIVLLALSPVPSTLAKTEREAGGDVSFGIGLTTTAAVLSIALTPALVVFLGRLRDRPYGESPVEIGLIILTELLLPLIAGIILRALFPRAAQRIRDPMMRVANVILTVASVALLLVVLPLAWDLIGIGTIAMFVTLLAYSCASRHPGVAISIAAANFPGENFAAAIILCVIVQAIVCPLYVRWQRLRPA